MLSWCGQGSVGSLLCASTAIWITCVLEAPAVRAQETPPPPGAPGTIVPDADAAERALERYLVLQGELLLPPGQIELEPSINYQYTDRSNAFELDFLDLDGDGIRDDPVADTLQRRANRTTAALEARFGLPRDSQIEIRVPYVHVDQELNQVLARTSRDQSNSGLGDIRLGFAKTLARENGAMPDLIGRITWDTASGEDNRDLSLTSGYDEVNVSLSALRRLDPLAVTGGVFYQTAFERDSVKPGDVFGFSLGTTLAASPTTALRFGFNTAFRKEVEIDGNAIAGSDENEALISFGFASVLRRNALLSVNFGAGLTDDSPDYFFSVSLPVRFTAWR